ncbi:acyl carrier protein [Pseudomonas sp. TE12234]
MDIKTQIETLLNAFWDRRAQDIIDDPLSTDQLGAPLDSISAVDAFVGIDKLVQRKLPVELIIRHGGYSSKEQFVTDVTDKVLRHLKEVPK